MSLPMDWFEDEVTNSRREKVKNGTPEYVSEQICMIRSTWYPQGIEAIIMVRDYWDEEQIDKLTPEALELYNNPVDFFGRKYSLTSTKVLTSLTPTSDDGSNSEVLK